MYLSHLLIDVGTNPDRPRPGRLWLRNIYHVHQRLSMAFPTTQRKTNDPHFLKPYNPADFPLHNLGNHVSRNENTGFLFRIDPVPGGNPLIIVQSSLKPNWDYAFNNAAFLLAAPPQCRDFLPNFNKGDHLRFRILINLSKKARTSHDGTPLTKVKENILDNQNRPKSQSKRVALTWDANQNPQDVIIPWFSRKAYVTCQNQTQPIQAFHLKQCEILRMGWIIGWKNHHAAPEPTSQKMKFRSALLEGVLEVSHPQAFAKLVASGIGSAKAFGFGLLSLSPVSSAQ